MADQQKDAVVMEITADAVVASVDAQLRGLDQASPTKVPTICKVPDDIRSKNAEAYDPRFISIGPYHQDDERLRPTKSLKLLFLRDLLDRSGENQLRNYVDVIVNCEKKARERYSDLDIKDGNKFVEGLVIDGCFVVEFLLKRAEGGKATKILAHVRNSRMLRRDLLLIENQIPFFVLREIFYETDRPPSFVNFTFLDLCLHYLQKGHILKENLPEKFQEEEGKNIYHLLHLHYLCLQVRDIPKLIPQPETLYDHVLSKIKKLIVRIFVFVFKTVLSRIVSALFIGLLYVLVSFIEVLIKRKRPGWYVFRKEKRRNRKKPRTIPTATSLVEAGVSFKKKESRCYIDVSFEDGELEIPQVKIQDNTNSDFRNLLAFEQTCSTLVKNDFMSYVVFMDNLIDTAADVELLKRLEIVESKLGCDEDVANFFNSLRSGLCFDYEKHKLSKLFEDVNEYCGIDHNRWRAKLVHDYFSSPWATISLIGAIMLLALTATQTAYSIIQAKSSGGSAAGPSSHRIDHRQKKNL